MEQPSIFKSRKFWLMISDLVFSLVLYFGAKYLTEANMADVKFLIAAFQPVVISVIAAITVQNVAGIQNGG